MITLEIMKNTKNVLMMIPQFDIKRQHSLIKEELREAVNSVMDSGWLVLGQNVTDFEKEFASP